MLVKIMVKMTGRMIVTVKVTMKVVVRSRVRQDKLDNTGCLARAGVEESIALLPSFPPPRFTIAWFHYFLNLFCSFTFFWG